MLFVVLAMAIVCELPTVSCPIGSTLPPGAWAVAGVDAEDAGSVTSMLEAAHGPLLDSAWSDLIAARSTLDASMHSVNCCGATPSQQQAANGMAAEVAVKIDAAATVTNQLFEAATAEVESCCGEASAILFQLYLSNKDRKVPDHWKVMNLSEAGWATLESAADKQRFDVPLSPAEETAIAQVNASADVALAKTRLDTLGPQLEQWQAQQLQAALADPE